MTGKGRVKGERGRKERGVSPNYVKEEMRWGGPETAYLCIGKPLNSGGEGLKRFSRRRKKIQRREAIRKGETAGSEGGPF